jgi:hypothetical protein
LTPDKTAISKTFKSPHASKTASSRGYFPRGLIAKPNPWSTKRFFDALQANLRTARQANLGAKHLTPASAQGLINLRRRRLETLLVCSKKILNVHDLIKCLFFHSKMHKFV